MTPTDRPSIDLEIIRLLQGLPKQIAGEIRRQRVVRATLGEPISPAALGPAPDVRRPAEGKPQGPKASAGRGEPPEALPPDQQATPRKRREKPEKPSSLLNERQAEMWGAVRQAGGMLGGPVGSLIGTIDRTLAMIEQVQRLMGVFQKYMAPAKPKGQAEVEDTVRRKAQRQEWGEGEEGRALPTRYTPQTEEKIRQAGPQAAQTEGRQTVRNQPEVAGQPEARTAGAWQAPRQATPEISPPAPLPAPTGPQRPPTPLPPQPGPAPLRQEQWARSEPRTPAPPEAAPAAPAPRQQVPAPARTQLGREAERQTVPEIAPPAPERPATAAPLPPAGQPSRGAAGGRGLPATPSAPPQTPLAPAGPLPVQGRRPIPVVPMTRAEAGLPAPPRGVPEQPLAPASPGQGRRATPRIEAPPRPRETPAATPGQPPGERRRTGETAGPAATPGRARKTAEAPVIEGYGGARGRRGEEVQRTGGMGGTEEQLVDIMQDVLAELRAMRQQERREPAAPGREPLHRPQTGPQPRSGPAAHAPAQGGGTDRAAQVEKTIAFAEQLGQVLALA